MFMIDRESATAQAADLVLNHFDKSLNCPQADGKISHAPPSPLFGIRRNTAVLRKITSNRTNQLLLKARNSAFPLSDYNAMAALFNDVLADAFEFPP